MTEAISKVMTKASLMFLLGAGGFIHELLRDGAERPFILALCGALMGLPFVLAADGWKLKRNGNGPDDVERWSHLP